ncbi:MAG: hypothetical protein R2739_00420 [Chitinophagales bacterium]
MYQRDIFMYNSDTKILFSDIESAILNLKIGRCVSENFDVTLLRNQILSNKYDICRLTVPASDKKAVQKLQQTGFLYFFSGSITRYKTLVGSLPQRSFIHHDLEFEQYDGTQDELLINLLLSTWDTYPIGYYRSPILNKICTKEAELKGVFEFYKKNNLNKNYPSNSLMFIKHKDKYVGFFALNIIDDRLESHIGGIVKEYRNDGYFFDMQEYIRRFCISNQLKYFAFGARNENKRVSHIFQEFGYRAVNSENVFHLVPLLSYKNNQEQFIEYIDFNPINKDNIHQIITNHLYKRTQTEDYNKHSIGINVLEKLKQEKYKIISYLPIVSESDLLIQSILYNSKNEIVAYAYLHSQP